MLKKCVVIAALALVLAPVSARADWLFTPNLVQHSAALHPIANT